MRRPGPPGAGRDPGYPEDLAQHNCLCYRLGEQIHGRWRFFRQEEVDSVQVRGDRLADDGEAVRRWALAGHRIAYKSALELVADRGAGRLLAVYPDWQGAPGPLKLICADRRQLSPLGREPRELMLARCAKLERQARPYTAVRRVPKPEAP